MTPCERRYGSTSAGSGGASLAAWVNPQPPHVIMVGVAVVVRVPYTETNKHHTLAITLVDEGGQSVRPYVVEGMPTPPPVHAEVPFNLGRPADLAAGEAQPYCMGANFNLGLGQLLGYTFEVASTARRRRSSACGLRRHGLRWG